MGQFVLQSYVGIGTAPDEMESKSGYSHWLRKLGTVLPIYPSPFLALAHLSVGPPVSYFTFSRQLQPADSL